MASRDTNTPTGSCPQCEGTIITHRRETTTSIGTATAVTAACNNALCPSHITG